MLIDSLAKHLEKCRAMNNIYERLDCNENPVLASPPTSRTMLVASIFAKNPRPMLVVIAGEEAAKKFALGLTLYLGRDKVEQMPLETQNPWSTKDNDPSVMGKRMRAISALHNGESMVVVASIRALMRCYPPANKMVFDPIVFTEGQEVDGCEYEDLPARLEQLGYTRESTAASRGMFSVHGDSMDVFSSESNYPVRIEFFGDEVDRIRRIVPSTGQTVADIDEVGIYPAHEIVVTHKETRLAKNRLAAAGLLTYDIEAELESMETFGIHGSQLQYLPFLFDSTHWPIEFVSKSTLTVLVEPRSLFDDSMRFYDELKADAKKAKASIDGLYMAPAKMKFDGTQTLSILSLIRSSSHVDSELKVKRIENPSTEERFTAEARALLAKDYTVVLGVSDRRMREEMKLELTDAHIPIIEAKDETPALHPKVVNVVDSPIAQAMLIPSAHLALLNSGDTINSVTDAGTSVHADPTTITFPFKPGDYVVHAKHGIAYFSGMEKHEIDGIWRDYLVLEYAAGDKLFIPVEQIGKVTKYVGASGVEPKLTRLDTNDWTRARKKASKAAKKLAFDLVDLYVRRSSVQGHAYSPDNEMQRQMEDLFPYEETSDQAQAIADVKADMESPRPMDRLICGDVGYGKTEVAIRAAFKAVQDGMQVMVLCPTTILAQQHYTTFSDRFETFPVNVDIISRFKTPTQQKKTLEGFASGTVDVLIGTHRLLSRDVSPKQLGLVIIDEEQKFGVRHKEQMKNLREHIDVLTLTATPIPRTLQMSLGGIRDMSVIDTPPSFRHPVEVYVGEWDEDIVSGAIRREMERRGQVYYVATKIADIDDAVSKVQQAVPEARIGFAHGRMDKKVLEDVMERFSAGELDVLVSTTIIESGLDNPHTNTLIIEDSQMLGLSQLYQLKGRVGRSHDKAYAYFMFPQDAHLTEEAVDRLVAIKENQDFGSGLKIAMRDLEIRGAGSLLGGEQSGNISAIGFEAFTAMLSDYVQEARGGSQTQMIEDTVIDLPADVYLPEEYITSTEDRVGFYRKYAVVKTEYDIKRMSEEMVNAYGEPPEQARNLIDRAYIQLMMRKMGIQTISYIGNKVTFDPIKLDARQRIYVKKRNAIYYAKSYKMSWNPRGTEDIFDKVLNLLNDIAQINITSDDSELDDDTVA